MSDNIAAATVTIRDWSGRSATVTGVGVLWEPAPRPPRIADHTIYAATLTVHSVGACPIRFGRPPAAVIVDDPAHARLKPQQWGRLVRSSRGRR